MKSPTALEELIEALRCLPGVGPKSAQRIAYHLLQYDKTGAARLAQSLHGALQSIRRCAKCNSFTELELCALCGSPRRDPSQLCVSPAAKHLAEKSYQEKLRGALQERFGKPVRLTVTIRETTGNTARDRAAAAVGRDAFVRDLVENFDATIVESSIKPVQ